MSCQLLTDKTAVVTGAARGLGLAIARAFLSHGANVALADIDPSAAQDAIEHLSDDVRHAAIALRCDVTSTDDVEYAVATAGERFGALDVMVNNAGFTRDASMRKMTEHDFDAVIAVHLKGCWLGTRTAAESMRASGTRGAIVNISSISGKVGNPGQTNYSAAKAGIVGLTKAAAKEIGHLGIRVNAIQPGLIDTEMLASMRPEVLQQRVSDTPLGRLGRPSEVADAAVFLASDLSSYITGVVLEVAGGRNI